MKHEFDALEKATIDLKAHYDELVKRFIWTDAEAGHAKAMVRRLIEAGNELHSEVTYHKGLRSEDDAECQRAWRALVYEWEHRNDKPEQEVLRIGGVVNTTKRAHWTGEAWTVLDEAGGVE